MIRPMAGRVPVVVQVLVAATLLLAVMTSLLASPTGDVSDPRPRGVLGELEPVRVSGPDGTVSVLGQVSTGSSASSIDERLAERLGYDLEDADTVEVESSIGDEERPVVPATLQIGGDVFATRVNVAELDEESAQVLLGREDLRRFRVVVGAVGLTAPGDDAAPTALGRLLAATTSLAPGSLLAVLPLATLVIVALRVVGGVQTLGIFSPVLLAIGYSQAGLPAGLLLTVAMIVVGFVVQAVLGRLFLPRMVRLAVLVGMVVAALLLLQDLAGVSGAVDAWGASLPVVVTAVVVERLWETWELDGLGRAFLDAAVTLSVAAAVTTVMLLPSVIAFSEAWPFELAIGCTLLACLVGCYRGMPLVDRFGGRRTDEGSRTSVRVAA